MRPGPGPSESQIPGSVRGQATEEKWYQQWMDKGFFHSEPHPDKEPYCIVIPPPNVTGALHLGHALNNTLQDTLIRWKRMQGINALWMPGTDHAGIATQNVVERNLRAEGKSRESLIRANLLHAVIGLPEGLEAS